MRIYIPATFDLLGELAENGYITARSGWGFALTPAIEEHYTSGDEEELSYVAFMDAARASLRLLAIGSELYPHRRVVISADLPDDAIHPDPDQGLSVVKLSPAQISIDHIVSYHVDDADGETATAAAIEAVDAADLGDEDAELIVGDSEDNLMSWYDSKELAVLLLPSH